MNLRRFGLTGRHGRVLRSLSDAGNAGCYLNCAAGGLFDAAAHFVGGGRLFFYRGCN